MDTHHADHQLNISLFDAKRRTWGLSSCVAWGGMLPWLAKHQAREQKDGMCFAPGLLTCERVTPGLEDFCRRANHNCYRLKVNVISLSAFVLDLDKGIPLDALRERLGEFEWAAYSSHGNTDERPRYRVVLPLAYPVPAAEWDGFWCGAMVHFTGLENGDVAADPQDRDCSRLYYWPSHPPGRVGWFEHHQGVLLDPSIITPISFSRAEAEWSEVEGNVSSDIDGPPIPAGMRNKLLYSIGCSLRNEGASEAELDALLHAINRTRCRPPITPEEGDDWRDLSNMAARIVKAYSQGCAPPPIDEEGSAREMGEEWQCPEGYKINEKGLWANKPTAKEPERFVHIAWAPIWIDRRSEDVDASAGVGTQFLDLRCERPDGTRRFATVPREQALNKRELAKLSGQGFPVTSESASAMVQFLDALETENLARLPLQRITSVPGWQFDDTFLVGGHHFTPSGIGTLHLAPQSPGEQQLIAGYRTQGALEAWKDAIAKIAPYPQVVAVLLACLAAPLLKVMGAPNFIMNLGNATSTGKTTAERIGASVWGNPNERDHDGVIQKWNTTTIGVERLAALRNGLPLILDDTRSAKKELVAEIVYLTADGRGKTRGAKQGMAGTGTFNTICISSGEQPLRSLFVGKGGAVMRILEIEGLPFGAKDAHIEPLVKGLNAVVLANYGHAGLALMKWLLVEKPLSDRKAELEERYRLAQAHYTALAGDDGQRLSDYPAALDVAAYAGRQALGLNWLPEHPMEPLWANSTAAAKDADDAEEALKLVFSWAVGHERQFHGRGGPSELKVGNRCLGRWDNDWSEISFLPDALKEHLEKLGYDPAVTIRQWKERDWMRNSTERLVWQVRIGGEQTRVYAVKRKALADLDLCEGRADGKESTGDTQATLESLVAEVNSKNSKKWVSEES